MGKREIRGLKARVSRECCISRGGPGRTMEVYRPEESEGGSHGVKVRCNGGSHRGGSQSVTSRGAAPGVRAAKSFEFGGGE